MFDPRMLGVWEQPSDAFQSTRLTISRERGHGYRFLWENTLRNERTEFDVDMVKIGDEHYLDLVDESQYGNLYAVPTHMFMQVQVKDGEFSLRQPDIKKFKKLLGQNGVTLKADEIGGRLVITSKTHEIEAFFKQYGDEIMYDDDQSSVYRLVKSK